MPTPLDDAISLASAEEQHMAALNDCFLYFAALAETKRRGAVSDIFQCLPSALPTKCDDETALRIHNVLTEFIERCPGHPIVGSTFRILLDLRAIDDLQPPVGLSLSSARQRDRPSIPIKASPYARFRQSCDGKLVFCGGSPKLPP